MWIGAHAQPACVWRKAVALFLDLVRQARVNTLDAVIEAPAHQLVEQDEVRGAPVRQRVPQSGEHRKQRRSLAETQEKAGCLAADRGGQDERLTIQLAGQSWEQLRRKDN